jgi:Predicted Zn-dependent peptidases
MKKVFMTLALFFGLSVSVSAQGQMPPVPVDPQVRIGHLDNGLTYYIRHNEEPKNQVHFYIAQKVGSILEEEDQRGLAHFLEHMCFNGSEHFKGNGVVKFCEKIGVQFGADLNAYTSIDETVYNIDNVPTTDPTNIDSCLYILYDWANGLLLADEDIDHERGVIHEEWRSRQNAQMRMYEQILPKIYPNNRYGQRLPIGLMSVVDNFPYQALRDYYEKWYRPDLQGLVVVGDINVDEIEGKIKTIFSPIKMPENAAERYYVQVEDNDEPIIAMAKDKEMQNAITYIFCKHDAFPREMKSDMSYLITQYAILMADNMISDRLSEITLQAEPPFMQAQIAFHDDFFLANTKSAINGIAVTSEEGLAKGVAAVYREMLRAVRHGFTSSEYERARADYLTNLESNYNERDKTKSRSYCSAYVRHFIDNEPIPGIENRYALMNQIAPSIPVEAINQILGQLMDDKNLVVTCMLPDKEGVTYPTEEEMTKLFADVAAEDIAPYEDKVSDEPLISATLKPGKVKKVKEDKYGYKKLTLSNGATVYLRTTDFKADQIHMRAFSKGGTSLYDDSEYITLGQCDDVVTLGGVGNFSATELQKALSGKKVSLSTSVGVYNEGMAGFTTPKDFETLLQLAWLRFTSPRQDMEAYQSYINRSKASLQNQELNPMSALQDTIASTLFSNKPRALRAKAWMLDEINYDRAIQIYKERFSGAADFIFVFTGNIDEATAVPLICKYIGSLPKGKKKENWKDIHMDINPGKISNIFEKEMEVPQATYLQVVDGKIDYNLKNILAFDFAGQILDILYTEEIREKEGGTYGVSVTAQSNNVPKERATMQIVFQCDPDRREYLGGRVKEILAKFAEEGPSEENLAKVKELALKRYQENLRENSYWTGQLIDWVAYGEDYVTNYEQTVGAITADDVCLAVKNLLTQGNDIEIVMSGKAKADAKAGE